MRRTRTRSGNGSEKGMLCNTRMWCSASSGTASLGFVSRCARTRQRQRKFFALPLARSLSHEKEFFRHGVVGVREPLRAHTAASAEILRSFALSLFLSLALSLARALFFVLSLPLERILYQRKGFFIYFFFCAYTRAPELL